MHIRYSCPVHARQALSRNASLIDASLRVGVVPCTEKVVQTLKNILSLENDIKYSHLQDIVGADASQTVSPLLNRTSLVDQSISEEGPLEIPSITPNKENHDSVEESMKWAFVRLMLASAVLRTIDARRFSRSRLSMASRAGMRSLTVSYDSRQEPKVRCYVFVSIYFDPLLRSY